MSQKKKKRKKIRFFNRPVKVGLSFAGVGVGLELGAVDIAKILSDYPTYIFWLEMARIFSFCVAAVFGSAGIFKQVKTDLESIKIGETIKEGVEDIETLKEMPDNTEKDEELVKNGMVENALNLALKFFNKRHR